MIRFNFKFMGASMLSVGLALLSLGPNKVSWWVGLVLAMVSPFPMSIERKKK